MPIPPLNEDGLLPLGLHLAEMNEIAERFGMSTPRRQMLFERLRMFVDLAQHCGALRMFVNGSYVTGKPEPGDVDVVIWLGTHFRELLLQRDWQALLLKQMFLKASRAFCANPWSNGRFYRCHAADHLLSCDRQNSSGSSSSLRSLSIPPTQANHYPCCTCSLPALWLSSMKWAGLHKVSQLTLPRFFAR